jgi:hypothetical protein
MGRPPAPVRYLVLLLAGLALGSTVCSRPPKQQTYLPATKAGPAVFDEDPPPDAGARRNPLEGQPALR